MPRSAGLTTAERRRRQAAGEVIPGAAQKQPPPEVEQIIAEAAVHGGTVKNFAAALGVSTETLMRWRQEYPEIAAAVARGRERERRILHDRLFHIATTAEPKVAMIACMFLLKSRSGYREGDRDEEGSRVNITFNMPAAQPMADFVEVSNADGTEVQRVSTKAPGLTRRS